MKNRLPFLLALGLLVCISCSNSAKKEKLPDTDKPVTVDSNAVSNYNFEADMDLSKVSSAVAKKWSYLGGWNEDKAKVQQINNRGVNNSRCLAIIALEEDVDVVVSQKITGLTPGKPYRVTARIKTESVTNGKGAQISLDYLWAPTSEPVNGTTDWTTVYLDLDDVPASGEITVCLRLGNTSAASKGVAYFDNVIVKENNDLYIRESSHVKLMIEKSKLSVSDAVVDKWLGNLDKVYEKYVELFSGRTPFNGRKMVVRQANGIAAWAYAGEPIEWNGDYISAELLSLTKGSWSFGIMHEIGHNFAQHIGSGNSSWNFDEELFANFRMYYAMDKLNAAAVMTASLPNGQGGYKNEEKLYVGKAIQNLYRDESKDCFNRTFGANLPTGKGDAICWTLIRIQEKYGWGIFIKAYDELYSLPQNTNEERTWTRWQKFEYFLSFLSKYAGEDVRITTYTQNELNLIKTALGG